LPFVCLRLVKNFLLWLFFLARDVTS